MTITWDFNTATLLAILGQAVLLIVFLVRTANTAKTAMETAQLAQKNSDEAHEKISALSGLVSLHREQIAREYVDKEALREMENRLMNAVNRLSDRITEAMDRGIQR